MIRLPAGHKYYESSENFGSGKVGVLAEEVTGIVTRVSYLDPLTGEIMETANVNKDSAVKVSDYEPRMICIRVDGNEIGWTFDHLEKIMDHTPHMFGATPTPRSIISEKSESDAPLFKEPGPAVPLFEET